MSHHQHSVAVTLSPLSRISVDRA